MANRRFSLRVEWAWVGEIHSNTSFVGKSKECSKCECDASLCIICVSSGGCNAFNLHSDMNSFGRCFEFDSETTEDISC